jgi:regulator of sirC expression with transglutaminase-like and TPR domain
VQGGGAGRPGRAPAGRALSAASRERLAQVLADPRPDLAEANLLMAVEAYPALDLPAQLARVDRLAETARGRGGTVDAVAAALRDAGLRGDREDYDDPRNSFLNDVLDRSLGLPIALSALTVAVAERVGAAVAPVGMPGHFIVADLAAEPARYLDPFDAWAELSVADCQRRVAETAGVPFDPAFLAPIGAAQTLLRMLANLRGSYLRRRRLGDALWTVELSIVASPEPGPLPRERAALLAAVGRYADAEQALIAYLGDRPDDAERRETEIQLATVRDLRVRMN